MKKKEMGSRRVSVKMHILAITTLPMLFACAVITFFASWMMDRGMQEQILSGLKSAATGVLISLDSITDESFRLEGGDIYKGDYNVTQNMAAIDKYAKNNDIQIDFFYGNTRKTTTIKEGNGKELVGTKAPDEVIKTVLNHGEEYKTSKIILGDKPYYGYYFPLMDEDGKAVGMVFAGKEKSQEISYIRSRINFIVIIAILNYISCFFVATKVSEKRILTPIYKLLASAKELAKGNIGLQLVRESNDEFGDLTDSFISVTENIARQAHVAERMAEGDLTVSCRPAGEADVMGHAIRKMIHDNNESLCTINDASEKMVTGVMEISSASHALAQGSTEQASAVEQITASIEGIAESAGVNANSANEANELAQKTRKDAMNSNEQMKQMRKAMEEINVASRNISGIMKAIDDIASQTNIISLNASVEAARAGVHGKGFAVVAEEVRNLASKSAEAARNSAEMIEDSIKKAEKGTRLATDAAESLENILHSVEDMANLVNGIAEASNHQSASVNQVNIGITQISQVVQANSATSEQCAAASSVLSELAQQLKSAVERYRLNKEEIMY